MLSLDLPLLATGKVRDLYKVDSNTILFVASDRISAFDVVMKNCVPDKGVVLNYMAAHWFQYLHLQIPDLKTHFVRLGVPDTLPSDKKAQFENRSMLVRRLRVFPIEVIVRGYISGSAWLSYKETGQVNGKTLPKGLRESQQLPEPMYTPSTKAEVGQHDENISIEQAIELVGKRYAKRIEDLALKVYNIGRDYAQEKGTIIADTKFEFGLDTETDDVVLIDEVLTPDSSRFWPARSYEPGRSQESFDKQPLRDWLVDNKLNGKSDVTVPDEIMTATSKRYPEAFKILTGRTLEETIANQSDWIR